MSTKDAQQDVQDSSSLFQDVMHVPSTIAQKTDDFLLNLGGRRKREAQLARNSDDIIVVVDDSPAVLTIVCALLKQHAYTTYGFRTGELALEHFQGLGQDQLGKVKAIYSDISMPGMGGLALLKSVRGESKFAEIPFVLVSATVNKNLILRAAEMKVNGFLVKPVTALTIANSVQGLFPLRKLAD